ncbi:hypothetical protein [Streptomyces xanthophaeus]|uniref:hypothetical protein n=1 Tax=Streptomyces xanthophaeus TaxID=67385 RepID=UPI00233F03AD|nr:hypothetical protein [Streptomyces xanthophaeus]
MRTVLLAAAVAGAVVAGAPLLPAEAADAQAPLSVSPATVHRGATVQVYLAGGAGGDAGGVDVSRAGSDWRVESPAFAEPAALTAYGKGGNLAGETRIRCGADPGVYTVTLKGSEIRTRTEEVRLTATLIVAPDAGGTPSAACAAQERKASRPPLWTWSAGGALVAAASAAGAWAYIRRNRTRTRRADGA